MAKILTPIEDLYYEVPKNGQVTKVKLLDTIDAQDVWTAPGNVRIISLVGQQKIAEKEGIVEKKFEMNVTPTEGNRQQHGLNIWLGFSGDADPDNWRRGTGEASKLNTGKLKTKKDNTGKEKLVYEEIEHIDSKYRFAMADKRAFGRALFKLIRLYGVYSEVDSADFLANKPGASDYNY